MLQKILFKPGVNRENTRYTTEGGWYECDKIRFRQGNPESIGGWAPFTTNTYQGVCRSLWNWSTLEFQNLVGVGTNLKFYICRGGVFFDITPVRRTVVLAGALSCVDGSAVVTVTDVGHGCVTGDFVTFSGGVISYGGGNFTAAMVNAEYQLTVVDDDTYTITYPVAANSADAAVGGLDTVDVTATYQLNVGPAYQIPQVGWGAGGWGTGAWGVGAASSISLRLWNQMNYGEDLVYGPRGGGIYYWDASNGVSTPGVALNTLGGPVTFTATSPTTVTTTTLLTEGAAIQFNTISLMPSGVTAGTTYYVYEVDGLSCTLLDAAGNPVNASTTGADVYISDLVDVPVVQNSLTVSDTSRFILALGTNDYGQTAIDPMLIRWSNQDDPYNWTPNATNQAGSIRLSHGSQIITAAQTRQEIVVFTDTSVYSLQYLGPPYVWQSQLLGDNISLVSPNAVIVASGITYWMGVDKFYAYDGRVQTLNCDLRRFVFSDFNSQQAQQVVCGTNEGFNEIWWFYPSKNSTQVDRYVVYNYVENVWYYGTMGRTAWLDSGLLPYPIAATYESILVSHENGINDNVTGTPQPLNAYIASSEFDIGDGHNFGFIWRVLPDLTFQQSTAAPNGDPAKVTMTLYGFQNSGSGLTSSSGKPVVQGSSYVVTEEFTGQIYTRIRARQMSFKIESDQINTAWQLGAPRIDIRQDGRR